jgi:GDPmannose 4,6-dehydratase
MKKALIFGVNGQDGHYLGALLRKQQVEVVGVSRGGGEVRGDVGDLALVDSVIQTQQPDVIFHLAANSTTRHDTLFDNHTAISTGTLNILESVRTRAPQARVFLSGSAMQFHNSGLPIDEQTPFEASSPYSIARIQSVYAARYYRAKFGLRVYVGYFFNHDSSLRSERHVNQKVVAAVQRIAGGSSEKVVIGNVDVRKEFNYAGDITEAVWQLVNQERVFEAVVGCGEAHSIQEWTEYCFGRIGRDWREFVTIDRSFVPEYQVLVSNPALLKSIGWRPAVSFHGLADKMMARQ